MNKFILVIMALSIFAPETFAQTIKVRRVKGNQAVVEFSGSPLRAGQTYDLGSSGDLVPSSGETARHYVVGLDFNLANTKSNVANSGSQTLIDINARMGWNLGTFELGPTFSYVSEPGINDSTNTTFSLGGFVDYNIITNIPGEPFIYGLGAQGFFGQTEAGSTSTKNDVFSVLTGPFVKWLPTGGPVGFRVDGTYVYQRTSSSGGDVATTGFSLFGGLLVYF